MLSPGAYLRKRREAAGLGIPVVAIELARLPMARRIPNVVQLAELAGRIERAETGAEPLTRPQAELLRAVYPFEPEIYLRLIAFVANPAIALPVPSLCRECGCSWHDACVDEHGPCAWADESESLCTACAPDPEPPAAARPVWSGFDPSRGVDAVAAAPVGCGAARSRAAPGSEADPRRNHAA